MEYYTNYQRKKINTISSKLSKTDCSWKRELAFKENAKEIPNFDPRYTEINIYRLQLCCKNSEIYGSKDHVSYFDNIAESTEMYIQY